MTENTAVNDEVKTAEEGTEETGMSRFMRDLHLHPRLTENEERELAQACAQGDKEAIKQMVASNLRLVVSIAREYAGKGVPMMDLIQEGSIGLISAAKKFDYTRNLRFSTYASKWIRQGIVRAVIDHNGMIRVPHYTAERMNKVLRIRTLLMQETGTEPTPEQIADQCDIDVDKVQELLALCPKVFSLDTPVGEDGTDDLQTLIRDLRAPQPEEELIRQELSSTISILLTKLTERQQQVIRLRYGLDGGQPHSLAETAALLDISKERVRQIEQEAMAKMKKLGVDFGLEDFLE